MVKVTYNGETRDIPKRYIPDSLTPSQRRKQIKSIFEGKLRPKLNTRKRRSSWTVKFNKEYGEKLDKLGKRSIKNIAKVTKLPYKALLQVYRKGKGAYYSGGSRPNQTPQSWGLARVYGYVMGNKKVRKVDKEVTEKYEVRFKH